MRGEPGVGTKGEFEARASLPAPQSKLKGAKLAVFAELEARLQDLQARLDKLESRLASPAPAAEPEPAREEPK